ncbi:hypothetical protein WICPIJ_001858 [Wickerhamomyces pijperi]|uniref:Uncharacterized protein n=1 Tax=Wickerhamomyces pijperi TaxID=599730 RepID=A0A9P8QA53_WICPI|nr:hypothetical protein WICPIJ_001858 [Wickerhamomyces pijperi]
MLQQPGSIRTSAKLLILQFDEYSIHQSSSIASSSSSSSSSIELTSLNSSSSSSSASSSASSSSLIFTFGSLAYFLTYSLILFSYAVLSRFIKLAASPFKGSEGFGYVKSCGRKVSKILEMSNIGDHV